MVVTCCAFSTMVKACHQVHAQVFTCICLQHLLVYCRAVVLLIGYLKGCVKKVIQMFVAFSFKLDYTFCELKSCNFISSGLRSIAGIDFCMSGIISMNIEHICWLHTLIAWILTIDFVCLNFVMLFYICPSRFRWDLSASAL